METENPKAAAALVVIDQDRPAQLPAFIRDQVANVGWLSWPAESEADKLAVLNAKAGGAHPLEESVPLSVRVNRALLHPWTKVDERSGEEIALIRCVLIAEDGECYSCSSVAIRDAVLLVSHLYGPGPWAPAIPMEISTRKLEGGRSTYSVKFTDRTQAAPKGKGK